MTITIRERLERRLAAGRDNVLLRFTLGGECLKTGEAAEEMTMFARRLERTPPADPG